MRAALEPREAVADLFMTHYCRGLMIFRPLCLCALTAETLGDDELADFFALRVLNGCDDFPQMGSKASVRCPMLGLRGRVASRRGDQASALERLRASERLAMEANMPLHRLLAGRDCGTTAQGEQMIKGACAAMGLPQHHFAAVLAHRPGGKVSEQDLEVAAAGDDSDVDTAKPAADEQLKEYPTSFKNTVAFQDQRFPGSPAPSDCPAPAVAERVASPKSSATGATPANMHLAVECRPAAPDLNPQALLDALSPAERTLQRLDALAEENTKNDLARQKVIKEGFLEKRASTGMKLLQRRYFRLTESGLLTYYKTSSPTESPRGVIDLLDVTRTQVSGGSGRGRLHLEVAYLTTRTCGPRIFELVAPDVGAAVSWNAALRAILASARNQAAPVGPSTVIGRVHSGDL